MPPSTAGSCSVQMIALPFPASVLEHGRDRQRAGRVELRRRLVEHEHARTHGHHARDGDPLLLAPRERERFAVRQTRDRQHRQGRVDPRIHLLTRHPQVLEPERQLLADGQLRRRELVGRCREDDPHATGQARPSRRVLCHAIEDEPASEPSPGRPGARSRQRPTPASTCRRPFGRPRPGVARRRP